AWPRQSVVPPVWFGNGPRKAESAFSNNFDSSCMAAVDYPQPVRGLIAQLKQLPGVGPKSAERMAVWLVQQGKAASQPLAEALIEAGEVTECGICGFFATAAQGCAICDSPGRDGDQLCIVEQPTDILPLERS